MDYKAMAKAALERRANLINELRAVTDDATLSDSEKQVRAEALNADIVAAEAEARKHVEDGEREAEVRALGARAEGLAALLAQTPEKREDRDLANELRALARGEVREVQVQADGGIDRLISATPEQRIALLSSTTNAGTTVANTFVAQIIESLRENTPIVQSGISIVTTARGEKMEWPVKTARLSATLVGENTVYTASDMAFTRIDLDAYKYGSYAEASYEMVNDSDLDLVGLLARDFGEALGDAVGAHFLDGTGTNQPQGLRTGTTLGLTGAAIASTFTFDNLIALQHAVIPKYRQNARFYTSDSIVLKLRQLKDNDGRYIYQDSVQVGGFATLLGQPVTVDVLMPSSTAASTKGVLYGDFGRAYQARFVRGVEVFRSDEVGFNKDVIAWKARVRADGIVKDNQAVAALSTPAT